MLLPMRTIILFSKLQKTSLRFSSLSKSSFRTSLTMCAWLSTGCRKNCRHYHIKIHANTTQTTKADISLSIKKMAWFVDAFEFQEVMFMSKHLRTYLTILLPYALSKWTRSHGTELWRNFLNTLRTRRCICAVMEALSINYIEEKVSRH